ncbi:Uncharacterised protein [Vibrio cholerae]|nr:Uncharacterised protein [Vibrio cholerae]
MLISHLMVPSCSSTAKRALSPVAKVAGTEATISGSASLSKLTSEENQTASFA